MGLQRCGLTRDIPTKFDDGDTIMRLLKENAMMSDIGNLLFQKHGGRHEGLWKITCLLGISFAGPGGREVFGPQVEKLALNIHMPQTVVVACLDAKSLKPLQAWISRGLVDEPDRAIFIGHGHSPAWLYLKDLISDRLGLKYVEFESTSPAGIATKERLEQILNQAVFAFLVMTAEDLHKDGSLHARENVIHEIGLFQGRLGFERAIVLLEESCEKFSNLAGVGQIRFPKGNIMAVSEKIRDVLKREGMISS